MTKHFVILKKLSLCGVSAAALMACAPNQYQSDDFSSYNSGYQNSGYGAYESTNSFGNAAYGNSYGGEYGASQSKSRYGDGASLRPGCEIEFDPCGFIQVVPVYPVYQVVTPPPPPAPIVIEPAPVVEAPVVTYEPAPIVYEEPEVFEPYVYTPRQWPEADIPEPTWKPIRK